jgi:hypothetical protein
MAAVVLVGAGLVPALGDHDPSPEDGFGSQGEGRPYDAWRGHFRGRRGGEKVPTPEVHNQRGFLNWVN